MNIKYALILPVFVLLTSQFLGQSSDSRFVQFMLTNIESREQVLKIDNFMRAQEGVEISRADIVSKKYLCIYNPTSGITEDSFNKWMKELDVEIKCYREGKFGVDKIIDQKMDCE